MSKITDKVKAAVVKAMSEYGDSIVLQDRNGNRYNIDAIARRPTILMTADATVAEYYFLVAVDDFRRVQEGIGMDSTPAPFFGDETILFNGETYVLRSSEPYEWYDGTRQVIRLWDVKKK